jgi:two-component system response regulator RstA
MEMIPPSPSRSVLLVEDDPRQAARIRSCLTSHGFAVAVQATAEGVPGTVQRTRPDVVVLDLALPVAGLLDLCRRVRTGYVNPILVLTHSAREEDELASLRAGADDLVSKPVRPRALLERIQARLERLHQLEACPDRVELPRITVDAGRRAARVDQRWVDLSTAEFEVLWLLAHHAGRTVPRGEICTRLRGFSYNGLDRTIDLRIARLRRKLGDDARHPWLIKSVRGEGYMLVREA